MQMVILDNNRIMHRATRFRLIGGIGGCRLPLRVVRLLYIGIGNEENTSEVNNMIQLRIMNETGHTQVMLDSSSVIEQIDTHPTHWCFINGEMVAREEISSINWDEVTSVDLTPAIVGGQE